MDGQKLYLRENVQLEPLINQWYAWTHLIPPATAAMNITNRHVSIMRSYVAAPQVHAAAVKNPTMRGGPFLDLAGGQVSQIRVLLEKTLKERAPLIALADAIKELNNFLMTQAKGYSLEAAYSEVPDALKGYVELIYDLNNLPSFRLIEPLLYNSPYSDSSSHSFSLSLVNSDERAFAFSTPRLEDGEHMFLKMPFHDQGIDELFKMRDVPRTFAYIKEALGFDDEDDNLFTSFLTEAEPGPRPRYSGDGVRVRYFGHACILVETKAVSILTDPLISYKYPSRTERFTYADLPESIDFVLITHAHSDHIVFESLLQLRHKIKNVIVPRNGGGTLEDPSLRLILNNIGFKNVIEIGEMETIRVDGGSITGVPFFGEHSDLGIKSKIAHLIRLNDHSILCAADSRNVEPRLYEHVHRMVGDIEVLFLGMECDGAPLSWLYGPLLMRPLDRKMDQSRRLSGSDFVRGMDIVKQFNCKQVYVYAMGQEPWLSFITSISYTEESKPIVESNRLIEDCRGQGIESERLYITKEILL